MKKIVAWVLGVCLFSTTAFSQTISGLAKDEQGKTLSGASIALKKAADSSVVKLAVSNAAGKYEFSDIQPGKYFINVSHVGLLAQNTTAFEMNGTGVSVPDVVLVKSDGKMKEVVVTSRKPVIEVRADKTVLNIEGSINAVGQDALELLRKSPGVMVDRDDNISMSGKNGVQIYIDGRPTPLSGKDLSEYLKTIQSSQIEAIELITNPSAKYDAAGNAGIINIKLKKNKSLGTNGSVNAGYQQGIFPKYNAGIALNNRSKRMNTFGNYTYSRSRNEMFMNMHREQLDTLFDQKSVMTQRNKTHGFKAGFDYFINSKQTFGVMANGNFNDNTFTNYSTTPISFIPTNTLDRILIADNGSFGYRDNMNFNANYRYADTSGRELNMDADYGFYNLYNDQMQPNYYLNPDRTPRDSAIYNMLAPTDIDIYTFKADYEQNFRKGRLGIGGKISYVESTNDFQRYNVIKSVNILDTLRSNAFDYTENINALYVNYNRQFKNVMVQLGLRVENTNAKGHSTGFRRVGNAYVRYDSTFTRNYTDPFPSAAVTFNKNPMKQWSFSYSRRIDRPAYQDLNPFEFKLDEYTFQKGNTELRPQYTHSIGATFMYKYKLTTTLNYSHVDDVFTQLIDTAEKSKSFITKKNLAVQDIVSLNVSYPFQYKWYSFFGNLNTYYTRYKADFGPGRTVNLDAFAYNFYMQHSARIGKKGWSAELSGWYSSPSIWQGTFESKEMWSVDGGVMKTVLKGKGNVKVSVSDIFQSMRWGGVSNFAGQYMKAGGGWESRLFKLNFTYRFGSNQIKAARQRKTGLEDENKRVGSQGGGIQN